MKDKNGIELNVGDRVIAFNPETQIEFMGTVEVIKKDTDGSYYAEVSDQDYDVFCLTSEDLEIES